MKILLIRLSSLGDVVLATAAVEALARHLPEAEVQVLTKSAFREVFRNNPGIHRVLSWEQGGGLLSWARHLRAGGFDRIVDLHGNLRTTLLRILTPGLRWCGYDKGAWARRLAVWLRRPDRLDARHVVDRYVGALGGGLGVPSTRYLPRVYPGQQDRDRVELLLREAGWNREIPLVAMAPGARWATKAWPPEHWSELVERCTEGSGAFPLLVGGPEDVARCERILGNAAGISLAGKTDVLETAAAIGLARVLVTHDSAALHLGTAVRTPVVALFGPTVRGFGFFPLGPRDTTVEDSVACRPCSLHGADRCRRRHHRCLRDIAPERVYAEVEARLVAS